jgi:Mlc titration factor MtfA (ptsG expression regulator)
LRHIDKDKKTLFLEMSNIIFLNYHLAESLVPASLRKEFRSRVLPWDYVRNEILPVLVRCKQMEMQAMQEHIKRVLASRIGSSGFGLKCEELGRLPEEIFAELIRGLLPIAEN